MVIGSTCTFKDYAIDFNVKNNNFKIHLTQELKIEMGQGTQMHIKKTIWVLGFGS
jgi:hypothetical protein